MRLTHGQKYTSISKNEIKENKDMAKAGKRVTVKALEKAIIENCYEKSPPHIVDKWNDVEVTI